MRLVQRGTYRGGSRKYLLESDGDRFECTVLTGEDGRRKTAFSCQIGCGVGCTFCATGSLGLVRDLSTWEISEQLKLVREDLGSSLGRLSASGQGEPLLNLAAVLEGVELYRRERGEREEGSPLELCTCGVPEGIVRLTASAPPCPVDLTVSLHCAAQATRDALMPGAARWPLGELHEACREYVRRGIGRLTVGYGLVAGVNDSSLDLEELAAWCDDLACSVELYGIDMGEPFNGEAVGQAAASLQARGIVAVALPPRPHDPIGIKYYRCPTI